MTARVHIADSATSRRAEVVITDSHEPNAPGGLVVYSEPRRHFDTDYRYFTNQTLGRDMNVNGAVAGTGGDVFADGLDTAGWLGLPALGWNYADVAAASTGAAGVSFAGASGVKGIINKTVGSTDAGLFVAMNLDIFLTTFQLGTQLTIQLRDVLGAKIGAKVDLAFFMNTTLLGVWQTVSIPIGLGGFGAIAGQLISQVEIKPKNKAGLPPVFNIDNAQFSKSGAGALGPQIYTLPRDSQVVTRILRLKIVLADAHASALLNNSMPLIAYNTLLTVPKLPIGIALRITRHNDIAISAKVQQTLDLVELPGMVMTNGGDGVNTWLAFEWTAAKSIELVDTTDKAEIIINDDLSGLLSCRVVAEIAYEVK